jgi:DNA segregation ATPase FtsK/SpoIIIE-like protein
MYDEQIIKDIEMAAQEPEKGGSSGSSSSDCGSSGSGDNLFEEAVEIVLENGTASVSVLQRRLGVGYPRAGKLIDELEKKHIIGPYEGSKPRKVLITRTEWLEIKAKGEENGGM